MKHLNSVNEGYLKHMIEAWLIVGTLIFCAVVCFLHSLFPFIFQTTASTRLRWIINRTEKRRFENE